METRKRKREEKETIRKKKKGGLSKSEKIEKKTEDTYKTSNILFVQQRMKFVVLIQEKQLKVLY
jgi:hypothetical protein